MEIKHLPNNYNTEISPRNGEKATRNAEVTTTSICAVHILMCIYFNYAQTKDKSSDEFFIPTPVTVGTFYKIYFLFRGDSTVIAVHNGSLTVSIVARG